MQLQPEELVLRHRIEQATDGRDVVGTGRDQRDHAGVGQDRVAQPLAKTAQRLGRDDQGEAELAAFVEDAPEGFGVECRHLIDDEEVLPPLVAWRSLAANSVDVVAADAHRPKEPRVVAADLRAVDHEQVRRCP